MTKLSSPELFKKATDTQSLSDRASSNKNYGSSDFDSWVEHLLDRFNCRNVLDVCCGTGNQLIKYACKKDLSVLCGVDVSSSSLQTATSRLAESGCKNAELICSKMEDMFSKDELVDRKFDLISCFYGLYYSSNPEKTLQQMYDHLNTAGSILIVGPYGKNNQALYDILQRYFPLPPFVLWSSTEFMPDLVAPWLAKNMVSDKTVFINTIRFPTVDAVLDYWKSSTFYRDEFLGAVKNDLDKYFADHGEFVLEKHVMACWGGKYELY